MPETGLRPVAFLLRRKGEPVGSHLLTIVLAFTCSDMHNQVLFLLTNGS